MAVATMSHVRVFSDGTPDNTRIEVDGKPLDNVVAIQLDLRVQTIPLVKVTMVMYVDEIDVVDIARVERSTREVARMSDIECLERALMLIGESGSQQIVEQAIRVLHDRIKEST
jgi:hypothetical protein